MQIFRIKFVAKTSVPTIHVLNEELNLYVVESVCQVVPTLKVPSVKHHGSCNLVQVEFIDV